MDPAQLDTQTYQPAATVVNHLVENGGVVGSHGVSGDVPAAVDGTGIMLFGGTVFYRDREEDILSTYGSIGTYEQNWKKGKEKAKQKDIETEKER